MTILVIYNERNLVTLNVFASSYSREVLLNDKQSKAYNWYSLFVMKMV